MPLPEQDSRHDPAGRFAALEELAQLKAAVRKHLELPKPETIAQLKKLTKEEE